MYPKKFLRRPRLLWPPSAGMNSYFSHNYRNIRIGFSPMGHPSRSKQMSLSISKRGPGCYTAMKGFHTAKYLQINQWNWRRRRLPSGPKWPPHSEKVAEIGRCWDKYLGLRKLFEIPWVLHHLGQVNETFLDPYSIHHSNLQEGAFLAVLILVYSRDKPGNMYSGAAWGGLLLRMRCDIPHILTYIANWPCRQSIS